MKIIHFSDLHAGGFLENYSAIFDKRILGSLNYNLARRNKYNLKILPNFINHILKEKPDVVVCTGDLTSTGQPNEFKKIIDILKPLIKSEIPIIYTPGNHDAYVKNNKCKKALIETFNILNEKIGVSYNLRPIAVQIKDLSFIIVNEAIPVNWSSSRGCISDDSINSIEKICNDKNNQNNILVGHYPLFIKQNMSNFRRRLVNGNKLKKFIDDNKIMLSLCGHIHKNYTIIDDKKYKEICAGSITMNNSYYLIQYNKNKIEVFEEIIK